MKKFLFLFILILDVIYAKETCYTVELISAHSSAANEKRLLEVEKSDPSCKMMQISQLLTVRCGCFEKYKDAKEHLQKFKRSYKDAYIRTTYKSRFETKKPKVTATLQTPKNKQTKQTPPVTTPAQVEEIILPLEAPSRTQTVQKELTSQPTDTTVTKKKQKKVAKTPLQKKEEKAVHKTQTKKKKKKRKKTKLVKKREARYSYRRYLDNLSNKRPIRPYGYLYSFGGEVSYDLGYVDQTPAAYSDFPQPYFNNMWRRVRINHKGSFFDKQLFYEIEYSFTGKDRFKDLYIGYKDKMFSESSYRIKAGNIKIPYSLQRYTTLKNLSFMERPLGDDAFSIKRKLGVELLLHTRLRKNHFGLFLAGYGNSIDEHRRNEPSKPGYSLRATYTYKLSKNRVVHTGAAYLQEAYKNDTLRYKQKSESNILEEKYVSTKIKNVDTRSLRNIDALYLHDTYYFEAGYMDSIVKAAKGDYHFSSYFLEGSYFFLGNGKRFNAKESKFAKVKVTKDTALELAFRYSYIDLDDRDEHGGKQTDYNFSLNWYLTPEFRVMMNYIRALPQGTDDYDGVINIYQMRMLFVF